MANFRTHLAGACAASGILATTCLYAGLASPTQASLLWITGTLAGLLPDIDSDNSTSLQIVFSLTALVLTGCLGSFLVNYVPLVHNLLILGGTFAGLHFIGLPVFRRVTVHRGNCHSLLALVFATFATVNLSYYLLKADIRLAFLAGLFTATGFMVHLLLDEIWSINFSRARLKKSFGTAFKLCSRNAPFSTMMLVLMCFGQSILLPELAPLRYVIRRLAATTMYY